MNIHMAQIRSPRNLLSHSTEQIETYVVMKINSWQRHTWMGKTKLM